jgi:hypothetical protein
VELGLERLEEGATASGDSAARFRVLAADSGLRDAGSTIKKG